MNINNHHSTVSSSSSSSSSRSSSSSSSSSSSNVGKEAEELPLIQLINNILINAVEKGVSDLHFEPYEKHYRLRMRQDGILYETAKFPLKLAPQISSRLKIMANLDISERRLPQDGRFKLSEHTVQPTAQHIMQHTVQHAAHHTMQQTVQNTAQEENNNLAQIDFRISSCPTLFGEKMVVRILDLKKTQFDIDSLGMEPFQKELLLAHLFKPQGMILVTGPTGSGKTLSLYTAIRLLNTEQRNILTCEDPVEIHLAGINQVNVNLKAGLNFANILRGFLRQDPDVIMLGEIRDLETAEIAIKAAQTGHLVLSTLHTNSAAATIHRLIQMGVPHFNLASSLSLIIAQRLARRLCEHCKIPQALPPHILLQLGFLANELNELSENQFFAPKTSGCEYCKNGYKGRIGIYELLAITPGMQTAIFNGGHTLELQNKAEQEGFWNLKKAALCKVKQGITSLEEIQRVIMIN